MNLPLCIYGTQYTHKLMKLQTQIAIQQIERDRFCVGKKTETLEKVCGEERER